MVNLCCGGSLQTGTQIIAISQMFFSWTALVYSVYFMLRIHLDKVRPANSTWANIYPIPHFSDSTFILMISIFILSSALGLLLSIGAKNRDVKKVKIWFYISLFIGIGQLIRVIVHTIASENGIFQILSLEMLVYFLITVYIFAVVCAFIVPIITMIGTDD